jgi:hypothetical protein
MSDTTTSAEQPFVNCGRSTAVGTPFFSGGRVIPPSADDTDAESSYLCEECADQIHMAARKSRLTDEQIREKITSGEIPGMTYKGIGGGTGYVVGGEGLGGPS